MKNKKRNFYWYYIIPEKFLGSFSKKTIKWKTIPKKDLEKIILEHSDKNICIRISADGFLHIEIKKYIKELTTLDEKDIEETGPVRWYFDLTAKYIQYLNALQLLIASEYNKPINWVVHMNEFQIQKLDNTNVVRYVYNSEWTHIDGKIGTYTKTLAEMRWWIWLTPWIQLNMQPTYQMKTGLSLPYIKNAFKKFAKISKDESKIKFLSHACNSICEYKEWNFAQSFILSWFFIESYVVENIREPYLNKLNTQIPWKINNDRKKKLLWSDSQFSISWIIEILELNKKIKQEEYQELTKLRKKRNDLIHWFINNQDIPETDAKNCIIKMLKYISKIIGIEIWFNDWLHLINYSSSSIPKNAPKSLEKLLKQIK